MDSIISFYRKIIGVGLTKELSFSEKLRIELCNIFVLISIHALLLHMLYNAMGPNSFRSYFVAISWLSISCFTLWLNYKRQYLAAKLFIILASLVSTVSLHILQGWGLRIEPMYILLNLSSYFFFEKKMAIIISSTIIAAFLVVATILQHFEPPWAGSIIASAPILYFLFAAISALILTGTVLRENYKFNTILIKQNTLLNKKNKEFERFNFILAHDLKTPIRHVVSFSRLLDSYLANQEFAKAEECLPFILSGANKLNVLLDDINLYSLIDSYAAEEKTLIDLGLVLDHISTNLEKDFPNREIEMTSTQLPTYYSSPYTITLLFKCLIYNGIIYNEHEVVKIEVSHESTKDFLSISIKDNGIGIKEENHAYIFEHFKRVEPRFDTNASGLGLSLSQKIIDLHDGKLSVKSSLNSGSTFTISLPNIVP